MAGEASGDETRFPRPPQQLLDELAHKALNSGGGLGELRDAAWVEHGSNSLVLLLGTTAVRVTRQPQAADELLRTQALVDGLPELPFAVARSRGDAVELDGYVAIPVLRLRGRPHPAGSGDLDQLRRLLSSIRELDSSSLAGLLAEPHSFMGGHNWQATLRDQVVPLLSPSVRGEALRRIGALADLSSPPPTLVHGDLAGSNVLWDEGRVSGVLDWDLASAGDPAEDAAALATWHGWSLLPELVDPETAARATAYRATFTLQVIAFDLINERPAPQIERAVARAERDLRRLD